MGQPTDLRTMSSLLGDALNQFIKLFQTEVDLAKTELGEKAQQIGVAVGLLAGGAVLVIPALTLALFALSAVLIAAGWSDATAYVGSAVVALVAAVVLFVAGMRKLQPRQLAPSRTMEQLRKDKDTIKGFVR
jgi:uncharacterized membrane protein YqjE